LLKYPNKGVEEERNLIKILDNFLFAEIDQFTEEFFELSFSKESPHSFRENTNGSDNESN